ncbi:ATP-binding protein [Actinacidiphila acididurans]|uniref:ATP-binding protein n=1 Tax=Actinacidiphila acididurans TaxID=2784346 RepID=A0ABS2U2T5_9ACTN|nr:ATP-binding protein [Actinacidiphila acididurans]MBM9509908.1 ATP-binding protein [Actinacidiphila acididurans]
MTAQWSDTVSGPRARTPVAPGPEVGPLDVFLRSGAGQWGLPHGSDGSGLAALRFDAGPGSAARTRPFLRRTLGAWHLPDLVEDAALVTAELVANAVTHALRSPAAAPRPCPHGTVPPPAAWLALLRLDRAVVCAVADPSPELPVPADPQPFAESGRGLRIVAELSESWGHTAPVPGGKTVWARLTGPDPTWSGPRSL